MRNTKEMILRVEGLEKRFVRGETVVAALHGIEFSIAEGEFVSIMGASGSGKSTLLNILTGLDDASGGEVWLEGRGLSTMSDDELTDLRRTRIGIVFQFFNLLPSITALENVALPLRASGVRRRRAEDKARSMLETVGLADRSGHLPGELSGGQMQRVAIARALAIEPGLLVADEPTGNLDSSTGGEILDLLASIHREEGVTILMVTHSPAAAAYGDRVISMADGRVVDIAVTNRGAGRERRTFAQAIVV
ncbi:MAG: ABC transporter ATP-binding protein [bacterium]